MTLTPETYNLKPMPVTKSAAKRVRQTLKRHQRNLKVKQNMKREIKALISAINENSSQAVTTSLNKANSAVDKAAKAGLIHKNKAARQKSQLSKLAKTQGSAKAPTTTKPAAKKPAPKAAAKPAVAKKTSPK